MTDYKEISLAKTDWLIRKIQELLHYRYTGDQIGEEIHRIFEEQNIKRYKYLVSLMYGQEKEILINELNLKP